MGTLGRSDIEDIIRLLRSDPDLKRSFLDALRENSSFILPRAKKTRRHEVSKVMSFSLPPECPIKNLPDEEAMRIIVHLLMLPDYGNGLFAVSMLDEFVPTPLNDERRLGLLVKLGLVEMAYVDGKFEFVWERKRSRKKDGTRVYCVRLKDLAELQRLFKKELPHVKQSLEEGTFLIDEMHSFEPYFKLLTLSDIQEIHNALKGNQYA
jgi:hypothetical protein